MITFRDYCSAKGIFPRADYIEQQFNIAEVEGTEYIEGTYQYFLNQCKKNCFILDFVELWLILSYKSWQYIDSKPAYSVIYVNLITNLNSWCNVMLPEETKNQFNRLTIV